MTVRNDFMSARAPLGFQSGPIIQFSKMTSRPETAPVPCEEPEAKPARRPYEPPRWSWAVGAECNAEHVGHRAVRVVLALACNLRLSSESPVPSVNGVGLIVTT